MYLSQQHNYNSKKDECDWHRLQSAIEIILYIYWKQAERQLTEHRLQRMLRDVVDLLRYKISKEYFQIDEIFPSTEIVDDKSSKPYLFVLPL